MGVHYSKLIDIKCLRCSEIRKFHRPKGVLDQVDPKIDIESNGAQKRNLIFQNECSIFGQKETFLGFGTHLFQFSVQFWFKNRFKWLRSIFDLFRPSRSEKIKSEIYDVCNNSLTCIISLINVYNHIHSEVSQICFEGVSQKGSGLLLGL